MILLHCEERRNETIQPDGSPRRRTPVRADPAGVVTAQAKPKPEPKQAPTPALADAWRVLLLNDPVNRMSYVVMVLRRVFGFDEEEARRHMLEVHENGRSVVWAGTREQAEAHMFALQQWHLTAIIQADEQ